jgi:malonyl-ACP decarboxylase
VGGASASGNLGLIQASRLIETGAADACVVVGALSDLAPLERQAFFNLGAMAGRAFADAPAAACRPFDHAHEGFVPGQAAACVILEAAHSAVARGVRALAHLVGYACKLDGNSHADPSEDGEVRVMTEAIARAGLAPTDIGYVNAHGTSSPLGDHTEVRALRRVFEAARVRPVINSTKGWVGHCLSAAGVVEAIAVIAQLAGDFVHPSANLERPIDAACRFAGAAAEPARLAFALSNAFGFGGINTSVVIARPEAA